MTRKVGKEGGGKGVDRDGLMQTVRVWKDKLEKERGPNHMQEVKREKK